MELILDEHQQSAVEGICESKHKITLLCGGAGRGKTTITAEVLREVWRRGIARRGDTCLAAPTGKAAVVMAQAFSGLDLINTPKTIHRLLGCQGYDWVYNRRNRLACDLVVIDEASMVDVEIMARIIYSISPNARILAVLDDQQLLPVGAGSPMIDLIAANQPGQVFRLKRNYRQERGEHLACGLEDILAGKMPVFSSAENPGNFHFHAVERKEDIPAAVESVVKEWYDTGEDWACLSPQWKGAAGIEAINQHLQAALNPDDKPGFDVFGGKIKEGDLVRHTKNNYKLGVFNGFCGIYVKSRGGVHDVKYNDELYSYEKRADLDQVSLGYCVSIHASQGSQYQKVVVVIHDTHSFSLCRSLLYVACSRARTELHIIGSLDAVNKAVKRNINDKRNTYLSLQFGGK